MADTQQPEALRLADAIKASGQFTNLHTLDEAATELRRQHARIAELEAQLESIGAGGVNGPLMARAEANAGSEAYGWLYDWTHSSATGRPDEHFTGFTKDKDHALKHRNVTAVYTHPSPPEGMAGWTKASKQLPPCRDDQDYIGINTAGFAGVFNAVADIAGNVHCMMETAEESVSIMSDLDIWTPFIRPPLPAAPGPADGESNV